MEHLTKLIISNRAPLQKKYGDGLKQIDAALDRVIAADRARGIATTVVWLDQAPRGPSGGDTTTSDLAARAAVDAVIAARGEPDYLLLLGAPDVLPHVQLVNPVKDGSDRDTTVPSDLPYASTAPFSREVGAHVGSTRKVGRVPDVNAGSDARALVQLLDRIAGFAAVDASHYTDYTAACAAQFAPTTRLTLKNLFNGDAGLVVSPPYASDPNATPLKLGAAHFYNVHGGSGRTAWYGSDPYPVLLDSSAIPDLPPNTLVSSEACYATQLFPAAGGPLPLPNQFLLKGAIGVFGSTDTLYGNLVGDQQIQGDLLTQYFLARAIGQAASLGQATLDARHQFVSASESGGVLDPYEAKTLGQCLLLGDPSLQPVRTATAAGAAALALPGGPLVQAVASSRRRLAHSVALGQHLQSTRRVARHHARGVPSRSIELLLRGWAKQLGLVRLALNTYQVPSASAGDSPVRFFEARGLQQLDPPRFAALAADRRILHPDLAVVAREEGGQVVQVRTYHRR